MKVATVSLSFDEVRRTIDALRVSANELDREASCNAHGSERRSLLLARYASLHTLAASLNERLPREERI